MNAEFKRVIPQLDVSIIRFTIGLSTNISSCPQTSVHEASFLE